ncbi:hypothetical protein JCM30760_27010 [Thiomicrorhabdus hydrogeniphila]
MYNLLIALTQTTLMAVDAALPENKTNQEVAPSAYEQSATEEQLQKEADFWSDYE